jgi:hypothetical protein
MKHPAVPYVLPFNLDVGFAAGIAYNYWIWRMRNLADCILAHGVTNACLAAYVLLAHQWQYWL